MRTLTGIALAAGLMLSFPANAQEQTATLTLDGLSYISFGERRTFSLDGGTIMFRFGSSNDRGLPFTIEPSDVAIPAISLGDGTQLQYGIASVASGSIIRNRAGEPTVTLDATLTSGLVDSEAQHRYPLQFTTEDASASSAPTADRASSVNITGMRLVEGARYVQLVGATTNRLDTELESGAAVSAVLSGTFDFLPAIP